MVVAGTQMSSTKESRRKHDFKKTRLPTSRSNSHDQDQDCTCGGAVRSHRIHRVRAGLRSGPVESLSGLFAAEYLRLLGYAQAPGARPNAGRHAAVRVGPPAEAWRR